MTILNTWSWVYTTKLVPMAGVEPAQLSLLPPQGSVSTNFTTSANIVYACFDYSVGKVGLSVVSAGALLLTGKAGLSSD